LIDCLTKSNSSTIQYIITVFLYFVKFFLLFYAINFFFYIVLHRIYIYEERNVAILFGFFSLTHQKNYLKENRQVYVLASIIVFFGFLAGAFYSNAVSMENYTSYSEVLKTYVSGVENSVSLTGDTSSDVKNILLIFFWSFFLFGKPFCGFFAFKSGFSIGFFISFFVKVYSFKGFLTGMAILLDYVVFLSLPLIILTAWSFNINTMITNAVFDSCKANIKKVLIPYLVIFLLTLFMTLMGNFINTLLIPKIIEILF